MNFVALSLPEGFNNVLEPKSIRKQHKTILLSDIEVLSLI